jgi:transcriptional regulator with XRE-family HTH domain
MNSVNIFSYRLAKLIHLVGASKKDFAKVLGVSPSYITQLTSKEGKEPSPAFIKLISRTFGVSEKWLVGELGGEDLFGYAMSKSAYESQLAGMRTKLRGLLEIKAIELPQEEFKSEESETALIASKQHDQYQAMPAWQHMVLDAIEAAIRTEIRAKERSPVEPNDMRLEHIKWWLDEFWKRGDEEKHAWLLVEMQRNFPEFKEWLDDRKKLQETLEKWRNEPGSIKYDF